MGPAKPIRLDSSDRKGMIWIQCHKNGAHSTDIQQKETAITCSLSEREASDLVVNLMAI